MSRRKRKTKLAVEVETVRSLEMTAIVGGAEAAPFCPTTQSLVSCPGKQR